MLEIGEKLTLSIPWPIPLNYQSWEKGSATNSDPIPVGPADVFKLKLLKKVLQCVTLPTTPTLLIPMPYPEAWGDVLIVLAGFKVTADLSQWMKIERNVEYYGEWINNAGEND